MPMLKPTVEFEAFNDGICELWKTTKNKPTQLLFKSHFTEKTVTYKRYYQARTAQERIDKIIRIPKRAVEVGTMCKIKDLYYNIEAVQTLNMTNPPTVALTLKKLEVQAWQTQSK